MSIESRLLRVVREQVPLNIPDSLITTTTRLSDDLGLDSLGVVELILAIEDEFDLEVDDDRADKFYTVGDILSYLTAT